MLMFPCAYNHKVSIDLKYNTLMLMFPCAYNYKVSIDLEYNTLMLMFPCTYNYKVEYRPGVQHSNVDVSLCIQL